jgi:hypothetical protein
MVWQVGNTYQIKEQCVVCYVAVWYVLPTFVRPLIYNDFVIVVIYFYFHI